MRDYHFEFVDSDGTILDVATHAFERVEEAKDQAERLFHASDARGVISIIVKESEGPVVYVYSGK